MEIKTLTVSEITEKLSKNGKKFWAIQTLEGLSASIWDSAIALHATQNVGLPVNYSVEAKTVNGTTYNNIIGIAPATEATAAPAVAPATPAVQPTIPNAPTTNHRGEAILAASQFLNSPVDDVLDLFALANVIEQYISGQAYESELKKYSEADRGKQYVESK